MLVLGVFASLIFVLVPSTQAALTAAEYDTLIQGLESTTPLPASDAPRFGSFYTLQHGESWPPLPGDTMNLPYWDLGGGVFVLDDREFSYEAAQAEFGSTGRFRLDDSFESDFSSFVYTTNDLWLQILGVASGTASLIIHPPSGVTNGIYDLLYATNLTQPIPWKWLLRTDPGQTNLAVPGATNAQGF